jgi:hypothetical protein
MNVIQRVSSDGLLKKETRIYFQTIYIAIWCTHHALLSNVVSTIVEAFVAVEHQLLYPCIIEWDRLCGLVVRIPGYRSRGPGSIPRAIRFSDKL